MCSWYFIADDVLSISGKLPPLRGTQFFLAHTILIWLPCQSSTSSAKYWYFPQFWKNPYWCSKSPGALWWLTMVSHLTGSRFLWCAVQCRRNCLFKLALLAFLQCVKSLNSGSCVCLKHWLQTRLKPTCCIGPSSFKQLISCCKFWISIGTAFLLATSTFCLQGLTPHEHWCLGHFASVPRLILWFSV